MARITYRRLEGHGNFFTFLLLAHLLVIVAGLGAFWYMEHHGHIVTGMNNRIVWGVPHVFAVFLIVAASGALNVASISSVFNKFAYKPFARLSGLLAISLLAGGLAVLVLDLGRPDRLIVAMTYYNFKSIFAWNIYLYMGFFVIVAVYLWFMMERKMEKYSRYAGYGAFVWRLVLTTGTGSIFGFLVAREAYDAAIMAPLFIASSFSYGLAFTVMVLITMGWQLNEALMTEEVVAKFRGLFIVFIAATLYFTIVQHLTNMYASEHSGVENFILLNGGIYTAVFWFGQILLGSLLPLLLLSDPRFGTTKKGIYLASVLVAIGGLSQMYVIIIGGQAYPMILFPGMEATSSLAEGQVAMYAPSLPEIVLGISGISIAMFASGMLVKIIPFLPNAVDGR
jgi:molybdopterin-containing oxidoreductase family membrane subunit